MKKELISVYSEDVRPLIMPNRYGIKEGFSWYTENGVQVLSGQELEMAKEAREGPNDLNRGNDFHSMACREGPNDLNRSLFR
jgi:hypothetical protein